MFDSPLQTKINLCVKLLKDADGINLCAQSKVKLILYEAERNPL